MTKDINDIIASLKPNELEDLINKLRTGESYELNEEQEAKLAHLPNRLSCEDIIDRASFSDKYTYWHIVDGLFDTMVDSRDASTEQEAIKFAYNPEQMQPWYSMQNTTTHHSLAKKVSSEEFKKWVRRE